MAAHARWERRSRYITPMKTDQLLPPAGKGSFRRRVLATIAVAVPLIAGCRETLTEVESGIVEPGTWAALKIEQTLPTIGDLLGTVPLRAAEVALADRWEASWDHGTTLGGGLRDEIHADAGALGLTVDSGRVRVAMEWVRGALGEVRRFGGSLPPHLDVRVEGAGRFLQEAERASIAADWPGAGLATLRAADALRETSPRSAALTLVEAAEKALGPPPPQADEEPAGRARARRLAWWSRIAIQRERYSLAIQRGYYACLLLGVRLP